MQNVVGLAGLLALWPAAGITQVPPMKFSADQRNTGRINLGNPMITAGGLAFIGATDDSRFWRFETMTGKLLCEFKLPATASSGPVSYCGKAGRS